MNALLSTRRAIVAMAGAGFLTVAAAPVMAATGAEAQVEAATRNLVDAYVTNDYERYFGAMADDGTIWSGGGTNKDRMTKQRYYDGWKANIERGGGIAKGTIEDLRIQISPAGDVGIATFIMPVTSRVPAGSPNPARDIIYKITHVWFQKQGRWELAHYYWSVVNPQAPGAAQPASQGAPAPAAR